jgi:phosphatidylglycerophosphate synthase
MSQLAQTLATPTDRRPIRARRVRIFQRMASLLVRGGVSANAISLAGMMCGIASGATLWATAHASNELVIRLLWLAAAGLVQSRLLANMLDGMVAVESGTASPVGELFNDLPDRVSDSATLIGLGYALGGSATLGWLAALLAMATAYVRAVGKAAGAGSNFSGPMAKPHRMFVVTIVSVWSVFSPLALHDHVATTTLWIIVLGCAVTLARRTAHVKTALQRVIIGGA